MPAPPSPPSSNPLVQRAGTSSSELQVLLPAGHIHDMIRQTRQSPSSSGTSSRNRSGRARLRLRCVCCLRAAGLECAAVPRAARSLPLLPPPSLPTPLPPLSALNHPPSHPTPLPPLSAFNHPPACVRLTWAPIFMTNSDAEDKERDYEKAQDAAGVNGDKLPHRTSGEGFLFAVCVSD